MPDQQGCGEEGKPSATAREIELLAEAPFIQVLKDEVDTWGHGVAGYSNELGRVEFGPLWLVENGPLRWSVQTKGAWKGSSVNLTLRSFSQAALPSPAAPYVELILDLIWNEPGVVLKLVLPFALQHDPAPPTWIVEEAFGQRRRPAGSRLRGETPVEEPLLRWTDVSDAKGVAVTVVNDYLGAADLVDGTLRLTLLRTPVFAHHAPAEPARGRHYEHVDLGKHRFTIRLYPHWAAQCFTPFHWAAEVAAPCQVVHENLHAGDLPPRHSFLCELDGQEERAYGQADQGGQWILHALKGSENGQGYVMRWQRVTPGIQAGDYGSSAEPNGNTRKSEWFIAALQRRIVVSARPWEIQTLLIPKESGSPVIPVDLREFPLAEEVSEEGQ
jgi:alpha-mannosidase